MKCNYFFFIALFIFSNTNLFSQFYQRDSYFDANENKWITNVKIALDAPERVYNLDLSNQGLSKVPIYIKRFTNLKALKLSDNDIKQIRDEFRELKNLEFVELSGNRIEAIDFSIFTNSSSRLKELWLRDNSISEIDSSLGTLKELKELNIGNNNIQQIDSNIVLTKLTRLIIDQNQLKEIPRFIYTSSKLEHLNMNSNQIDRFHFGTDFLRLEHLDVGDNPIDSFTVDEGNYKLVKLVLDWVKIEDSIIAMLPKNLRVLSLEHCALSNLEGISNLSRLKELSILHNQISYLPESMNKMKRLEKIWLGGNKIDFETLKYLPKKAKIIH